MYKKIAIVGAGSAGAFLASLLTQAGVNVDIYEKSRKIGCFCAWGTIESELKNLLKYVGLNFEDYILSKVKRMIVDDIELKVTNLVTFNKPKLIYDLIKGLRVLRTEATKEIAEKYDLIIDATGYRRSLLPKLKNDLLTPTIEYVIRTKDLNENTIYIKFGKIGYAWIFPMGDGYWHIGAGDIVVNPILLVRKIFKKFNIKGKVTCSCESYIRSKPPAYCKPIVYRNIVGCGESIGTVFPITGEGIAHSMKCSLILFNHILNGEYLEKYEEAVIKEFKWFNSIFKLTWLLTGPRFKLVFPLLKSSLSILKYVKRLGAKPPTAIIKALIKLLLRRKI
ncbi:MAG: hypothetical protein DRO23_02205 [Thermoprotei archaeon]|nr:MAG: hypothetical protein DRO23_02205 [Thermoprotei archaeon]